MGWDPDRLLPGDHEEENMKKYLALLLSGVVAASLAACGSSNASDTAATAAAAATTAAEAATEAPAADAAAQSASGSAIDLSQDKYAGDGVLTVGTNATFPPFEEVGDDGKPAGFDIDLMNAIGEKLGVEVEWQDLEFDSLVASIGTKIDAAASGMTITEERKKAVNFSDPYYDATQCVLLPTDSTAAAIDDLKELKIGVQSGTTGETISRESISDANTVAYNGFNQAVNDLVNGKVGAVVIDTAPAAAFQAQYPDQLKVVDGSVFGFDVEQYGIALPKDDQALTDAVNQALQELKDDGTYDKLIAQDINAAQ